MTQISNTTENSSDFQEIVLEFQKILLKFPHNFKFSCETEGNVLKISAEVNTSVDTEASNKTDSEGWISNVGNDTYTWPDGYGITKDTLIEVMHRSGHKYKGNADEWLSAWKEVTGYNSVIKFRILK